MSDRPHILFVSTFYPQPDLLQYCQFVHEEARALVRKGYDISVINPRSDIKALKQWSLDDIPILCLPYCTWRTNYSYIINSRFLFNALVALGKDYFLKFDLIHVHNCLPEGNALLLLRKHFQLSLPLAVQIHDLNVYKGAYLKLQTAKYIFRKHCIKLYQNYDYCIGISDPVTNLIQQCLPDNGKQKTITAYNGYNPNIFNQSGKADSAPGTFPIRILFVGNMIELKGIRNLIHGYCQCYPHFIYPTELWILGRGILEADMKALVNDYHMDEHVAFKGYMLPTQVAQHMNQCHIFAMPSTFEGLGCVYLEAMACGLPCIACTEQGISNIIKSHNAGILIPPHDLDALKKSLLLLVNHPELRREYISRINRFISEYTWDETVNPISELYHSALFDRQQSPPSAM